MICVNCGADTGTAKFCPECGTKVPDAANAPLSNNAEPLINSQGTTGNMSGVYNAPMTNSGTYNVPIGNPGSYTPQETNTTLNNEPSPNNNEDLFANSQKSLLSDGNNQNLSNFDLLSSTPANKGGKKKKLKPFSRSKDKGNKPTNSLPTNAKPIPSVSPEAVNAKRSFIKYILLTMVTGGIYGLIFIHKLSKDINIVCDGDGEHTDGLGKVILLSLITLGIYSYIWIYLVGERLYCNAPRYNRQLKNDGTSIIGWMVFGSLLCGIGPFVGIYKLIKNTNTLCEVYNATHGFY